MNEENTHPRSFTYRDRCGYDLKEMVEDMARRVNEAYGFFEADNWEGWDTMIARRYTGVWDDVEFVWMQMTRNEIEAENVGDLLQTWAADLKELEPASEEVPSARFEVAYYRNQWGDDVAKVVCTAYVDAQAWLDHCEWLESFDRASEEVPA